MSDRAFDVSAPLPSGVTLLEASAGTGKTFTIAALVARYVAEGTPLERLLVVTFTRMATSELRERVRDRLVTAAEGLAAALANGSPPADDLLVLLASGPRLEVRRRHDRLAKAIADFDAATIETTHGFCLHVLVGLGVAGDVERDVTFVEDVRDLLDEVVDDLYVRRFWSADQPPPFPRAEAIKIGRAVLANPSAEILPALAPLSDRSPAAMRRRLAGAIRTEIEDRKRAAKLLTYDDLLTRLDNTLADDTRGAAACERLRARYDVALVDEFQDTDPVQWDIMRRAFGSGRSTLVLIGDPKQAIYAFRGADVYSYLKAADHAVARATLSTNWRSDQGLITAYDALFAGSQLGHEGIAYRTVRAAPPNVEPRLHGAGLPLRIRVLDRNDVQLTDKGYAALNPARTFIAHDLAADVVRLLGSGAQLPGGPVRPGHIAVLVRANHQAATVCDALHAAGVPAVSGGTGSVFSTGPATEWLSILDALEHPTARDRAAEAALTSFIGWPPERVANADEDGWEELHWLLHRWADLLRRRGVAALLGNMSATHHLPSRILARPSGERFLTDLRHVGQLLHAAATAEGLGSTALTAWLRRRIEDGEDGDDEDRSRRLESDAEAVQVLTIHRSKGLEFPIVYCPYLWDVYSPKNDIPMFHDPSADDRRTIDVGGRSAPGFVEHGDLDLYEQRGEDVRLLYVALTRACHQAVVWWAGTWQSADSPLSRLLFDRDGRGVVAAEGSRPPTDAEAIARFEELAAESAGSPSGRQISVERVDGGHGPVWPGEVRSLPHLEAGVFDRVLDDRWRRTSYTGITAPIHEVRVGSEPEEGLVSDEDTASIPSLGPGAATLDAPLLLADMPGGAEIGTLIHRVLEVADFAATGLRSELRSSLDAALALRRLDVGDPDLVVAGLEAVIDAPLGPMTGGARLRDVGRSDRLDELTFEFPLVGGDVPTGRLSVTDIAALLRSHVPTGDPLSGYAERLDDPALDGLLRGYLTGSLDLVFRTSSDRFVVVDYKTNWLGTAGDPLTAWHYRADALRGEMYRAHYPLQALLYLVALHRYLRWRVRGYDATRHLGGALYLFVRGMSGRTAGDESTGVWSWRPPASLVAALSDLFDRGAAA